MLTQSRQHTGASSSFLLGRSLPLVLTHEAASSAPLRAGRHLVAFLERGQLLLVAVSAMGEPPATLRRQLILVHGQVCAALLRSPGKDCMQAPCLMVKSRGHEIIQRQRRPRFLSHSRYMQTVLLLRLVRRAAHDASLVLSVWLPGGEHANEHHRPPVPAQPALRRPPPARCVPASAPVSSAISSCLLCLLTTHPHSRMDTDTASHSWPRFGDSILPTNAQPIAGRLP